jgi:hypothetical protein
MTPLFRDIDEVDDEDYEEVKRELSEAAARRRTAWRQELLVCVANARREQDAGRGEGLHPLLNSIAKLPPEIVRSFVVPYSK